VRHLIGISFLILSTSLAVSAQCVEAIVNAATYVQPLINTSGVVPGEVLTLFGTAMGPPQLTTFQLDAQRPAPTTLTGRQVLFDGIPAPLLYVSASQVSGIVPYGDSGQTTTIQVAYQNVIGPCYGSPDVVASAPGIFTADQSGLDQAAAFNQDGSVNGTDHPAAPGSVGPTEWRRSAFDRPGRRRFGTDGGHGCGGGPCASGPTSAGNWRSAFPWRGCRRALPPRSQL
jgi:hypothetical protein